MADLISSEKLNLIVTELFITGRKLKVSLAFVAQFLFYAAKYIRLNSTQCYITNISN